jgi:hypothetical protein
MATLVTTNMEDSPIEASADAAGDQFYSDPDVFLRVRNDNGPVRTLTIKQAKLCNHTNAAMGDHDTTYNLPAFTSVDFENKNLPDFFATDWRGLITVMYPAGHTGLFVSVIRNRSG